MLTAARMYAPLLFHLIPFKVKLAVSGSWESALLKVCWPDDLPPDETLVSAVDQSFAEIQLVTKQASLYVRRFEDFESDLQLFRSVRHA